MQWLRLHSEARTDNKLRTLTDAQHRVWFNLLCYAGEQERRGQIPGGDDFFMVAIECANGDEELLRETVDALGRLRILQFADDGHCMWFVNWEKRQYEKPSDRPEATAERKRRSRERAASHAESRPNKEVSRDVTPGHATDTDTDTDTEQKQRTLAPSRGRYSQEFETFWTTYPKTNGTKLEAFKAWKLLAAEDRAPALAGLAKWKACEMWRDGKIVYAERYLKRRMWDDDPVEARTRPFGEVRPEERRPSIPSVACVFKRQRPAGEVRR
jgi:hypothetical protein